MNILDKLTRLICGKQPCCYFEEVLVYFILTRLYVEIDKACFNIKVDGESVFT